MGTLIKSKQLPIAAVVACVLAALAACQQNPAKNEATPKPAATTAPATKPAAASNIAGDVDAGADYYDTVCSTCHSTALAPTLRGVVNRHVASVASFDGYSDALLAKKSMTWTQENLNKFLTNPSDFIPGTYMNKSIPDAHMRANVIAYLASLPAPRN